MSQVQESSIHVNGVNLAYIEQGAGTPVVFVHGGLGDYRSWTFQIEPFARHYRVVAYSRRYHFRNEITQAGEYSAMDHRDDLAALIRTLGLAPAHLVAGSYGAYISLLLAASQPDLVRSLVLGEPPVPTLYGPDAVRSAGRDVEASRLAFERGDPQGAVRVFIDKVVGAGGLDRLPPRTRQALLENAPEFRVEVNTDPELYYAPFGCEDARRIEAPVLLVTGQISPAFLHQMTGDLAKCLRNAERVEIPNASHSMHTMNPEEYNRAVLAFLAAH